MTLLIQLVLASLCVGAVVSLEPLNVGLLIPYTGWPIGSQVAGAAVVALDTINELHLLDDYEIIFDVKNSGCDKKKGVESGMRIWEDFKEDTAPGSGDVHAYIGAGCSSVCEPMALVAGAINTTMISYSCTAGGLSNKGLFPTFSRVVVPWVSLAPMYAGLMEYFHYTRIAIIADVNLGIMTSMANAIKIEAEKKDKLVYYYTVDSINNWKGKPEEAQKKANVRNILSDIKQQAKVIILLFYNNDNMEILMIAKELGMTNGDFLFSNLEIITKFYDDLGAGITDETVRKFAKDSYVGFLNAIPADELGSGAAKDQFAQDIITAYSHAAFVNATPPVPMETDTAMLENMLYAALVHDAVVMYAWAVNKTIDRGFEKNDGWEIANSLVGSTVEVDASYLKSGKVVINSYGDRLQSYDLVVAGQGADANAEKLMFRWNTAESKFVKMYADTDAVTWAGNAAGPPPDAPSCGWNNENCPDNTTFTISVIVGVLAGVSAMACVVVFLVHRRMRFEAELAEINRWKVEWEDVLYSAGSSAATLKSAASGMSVMSQTERQVFTEIATYESQVVAIRHINKASLNIQDRLILIEMKQMLDMQHENINKFVGACVDAPNVCYLMLYAQKGSLQDVLQNETIELSWDFKMSLADDIAKGMVYVHKSVFRSHGHLASSNCVVDSRWICKITDYGLGLFKQGQKLPEDYNKFNAHLWTAPELVRRKDFPTYGTKFGDVYSYGIILSEIATQDNPYARNEPEVDSKEIVTRVGQGESPPFRPHIPAALSRDDWQRLMQDCWGEFPEERPDFSQVRSTLKKINKGKQINVVEQVIKMLEQHSTNLEKLIAEKTKQVVDVTQELVIEKEKAQTMMHCVLPKSIVAALEEGQSVAPQQYSAVTLHVSELVGLTKLVTMSSPQQVIECLNDLQKVFDDIANLYEAQQLETLSSSKMIVSGAPKTNGDKHAAEMATMSLHLVHAVSQFKNCDCQLRVGIHTGPALAGVVGQKMPRYCVFGQSVTAATKMQAASMASRIIVSGSTASLLKKMGGYRLVSRPDVVVEGSGNMESFWLTGKDGFDMPLPDRTTNIS